MRPLTLRMKGLAAFREEVVIDFEGADLFALVGPTGSGKSTVLDAIVLALYGSVPRYLDQKRVDPVVSTGALEAKVELTFEVERRRFRVVRGIRRKADGGATTRQIRLEEIKDGGEEHIASKERDVSQEVEKLLGLSFDDFTRCVLLPQGEFARFLQEPPSKRQDILINLLDLGIYGRLGQRARELAGAVEARIAVNEERLAAITATEESLVAALRRRDGLREVSRQIALQEPELARLERDAAAARQRAAEVAGLGQRLAAISAPAGVSELAAETRAARERRAELQARLEKAQAEVAAAEEALARGPAEADLVVAARAHVRIGELAAKETAASRRVADAAERADAAREKLRGAEAAELSARAALEASRTEHAAHALRAGLEAGEPCPVCRQKVAKVPRAKAPTAMDERERELRAAIEAVARAREALQAAETERGTESGKRDELARQLEEARRAVAAHPDAAAVAASLAKVKEAVAARDAARDACDKVRREERQAVESLQSLERRSADMARRLEAARDGVAALGPPPPARQDVAEDWRAILSWASEERRRQEDRARDLSEGARGLDAARAARFSELLGLATAAGAELPEGLAKVHELAAEVASAQTSADAAAAQIEKELHLARDLRAGLAADREEARVARTLGQHLQSNAFLGWVLHEVLERLAAAASGILRQLSSGHYSLAVDPQNSFAVVDHREADQVRMARSLSGGETFQASLALALALADEVARLSTRGQARLESLFLDEGFGTLDEDSLEQVAAALEALASRSDRMVGIVTHVASLAERMPVRFAVRQGEHGSVVERVGAGAGLPGA